MSAAHKPHTRILSLYARHGEMMAAISARIASGPRVTDDQADRLYAPALEIEAELLALPCTCAGDFAAKMMIETAKGSYMPEIEDGRIWADARELIGGAA